MIFRAVTKTGIVLHGDYKNQKEIFRFPGNSTKNEEISHCEFLGPVILLFGSMMCEDGVEKQESVTGQLRRSELLDTRGQ